MEFRPRGLVRLDRRRVGVECWGSEGGGRGLAQPWHRRPCTVQMAEVRSDVLGFQPRTAPA